MAVKKMRTMLSASNRKIKQASREINKLNAATGGRLLNNPIGSTIVPYANAAARVVDYFDDLMPLSGVDHMIANGTVAGVSNTRTIRRSAPRVTGSRGKVTITHKELLGDISTIGAAVITTSPTLSSGESVLSVNPTNPSLFPWLSTIARNYDYFKFKRVRIAYVPICATSTVGRVELGFDPDATDALPYSRNGLSSYSCSADGPLWNTLYLDCALPNNQPWYQTNTINSQAMFSTSSMGAVHWATWGASASAVVGEAYVMYEVELKDPQPGSNPVSSASGTGLTVSANFPFYSGAVAVSDLATDIKLLFNAVGTFRVHFFAKTTAATAAISLTVAGNIALNFAGKVSDGTDAIAYAVVTVTGTGQYDAPGHATGSFAVLQCNGLAALGAWTTNVELITLPTVYP